MQVGLHGHRGKTDESCETTGEVTEDAPKHGQHTLKLKVNVCLSAGLNVIFY